jgi:glucose/arabinose dehydrogenase
MPVLRPRATTSSCFILAAALLAAASAHAAPTVSLDLFANVGGAVDITNAGDSRLFVVDREGSIWVVQSDGSVEATPFLDITDRVIDDGEGGLLGLAFHPDYATNGSFYVNYTRDPDTGMSGEAGEGDTRIARFSRIGAVSSNTADPASELPILDIEQPDGVTNHKAGDLNFGPDGYLWFAMGDGGGGGDPFETGQDGTTLLGKMVRIDVDSGSPYAVPADNPFLGGGAPLDEIWATGFRNPFRFSFDRSTGDLWIADVGQGDHEEIDLELAGDAGGRNYGWDCYEGFEEFETGGCGPIGGFTFPIHTYDHSGGRCSVTGGFVYRGATFGALLGGHYFFADYCSGDVYSLTPGSCPGSFDLHSHGDLISNPVTFGESATGEIYVASQGGNIYRVEATGTPDTPAPCLECPASPQVSCRQPGATKASLLVKNDDDDAKDRLVWKWLKGDVTPKEAFGDPLPPNYVLCTYLDSTVVQADIPSAASCPTCWRETATGFKFKSSGGEIASLILKAGDVAGKAKIIAKGKGTALPDDLPAIPLVQPVTVQLINADGECWEATYSAPASKNEDGLFRDKSD